MPGAGKSTLGKKLASQLNWNFLDLDKQIVEAEQQDIASIFMNKGELYFREREEQALLNTFSLQNYVVACGGGTAAYGTNMEKMIAVGLAVYLEADLSFIMDRINQAKSQRPMFAGLKDAEKVEKIRTLMEIRSPFYEQAQMKIKIPLCSVEEFKNMILTKI